MITRRHALALSAVSFLGAGTPFRLGIAGLVHGHVRGFFRLAKDHPEAQIVGISELDSQLREQYKQEYNLDSAILYSSLTEMLEKAKPDAVMLFTSTADHRQAVEECAARKVHVMMEKPLAISNEHASAIAEAAKRSGIHVLVNYETTWYPSNPLVWSAVRKPAFGRIRKTVIRDGHNGPKEIGVGPEFLDWLTDPARNGAGALFDFGCYGANIMTWLMDNKRPTEVTAQIRQFKPAIYSRVDDDATILLEYEGAQATIEASWNWPFSRKDMEIYGETGSIKTFGRDVVRIQLKGEKTEQEKRAPALAVPNQDYISYLAAVVRGTIKPSGLSSLENNLIVTEILEAARDSARTGRTVRLSQSGKQQVVVGG